MNAFKTVDQLRKLLNYNLFYNLKLALKTKLQSSRNKSVVFHAIEHIKLDRYRKRVLRCAMVSAYYDLINRTCSVVEARWRYT